MWITFSNLNSKRTNKNEEDTFCCEIFETLSFTSLAAITRRPHFAVFLQSFYYYLSLLPVCFLGTFKLIFAKRVNWKVIGFLWKVRCKLNGSLFLIKTEVTLKFRLLLLIEEKIEIQNEMFNLRFPKNILDFSKREKPINFLYCLCFWQANLKRKNFPPQKTKRTENNFCRFYSWHLIAFT